MVPRRLPDLHDVPYDTPSSSAATCLSVTLPSAGNATLIEDVHASEPLYANSTTLISTATASGACVCVRTCVWCGWCVVCGV